MKRHVRKCRDIIGKVAPGRLGGGIFRSGGDYFGDEAEGGELSWG